MVRFSFITFFATAFANLNGIKKSKNSLTGKYLNREKKIVQNIKNFTPNTRKISISNIAKNILGISENVENAGKLLFEIVFDPDLNNIEYLHLSNKLVFYKKHKLVECDVSEEANETERALKLWNLSEELCQSFGFVSLNI